MCSAKPPVQVKQSSARPRRILRGSRVVFALIQKNSGLLPFQRSAARFRPFIVIGACSGASPLSKVISSGNDSFWRMGTSFLATIPSG